MVRMTTRRAILSRGNDWRPEESPTFRNNKCLKKKYGEMSSKNLGKQGLRANALLPVLLRDELFVFQTYGSVTTKYLETFAWFCGNRRIFHDRKRSKKKGIILIKKFQMYLDDTYLACSLGILANTFIRNISIAYCYAGTVASIERRYYRRGFW